MDKFAIVEEQFEYKGHDCICIFTEWGVRCGYVSVDKYKDFTLYNEIDCHGGITFSDCLPHNYGAKAQFYIGFDCAHCYDAHDFDQAFKYGLIDKKTRDR